MAPQPKSCLLIMAGTFFVMEGAQTVAVEKGGGISESKTESGSVEDVVIRCIEGVNANDTESLDSDDQKVEELMGFCWSVVRELTKCQCR